MLEHCAAHRVRLGGITRDCVDDGRRREVEIEQLPQEVEDVADAAILEHSGDLRTDLGLGGFAIHPLDDGEARPEHASEDVVRRPSVARRPAMDARRRLALAAGPREKVADEARLADARCAEDRDGPLHTPRRATSASAWSSSSTSPARSTSAVRRPIGPKPGGAMLGDSAMARR